MLLAVGGAALAVTTVASMIAEGTLMADAHAYWSTGQDGYVPYGLSPGERDAYLYSPVFAQLIRPLTLLPWPMFAAVWIGLEASAFWWLLRPLGTARALVALLWCVPELAVGNVVGFLALAIVVGLGGFPQAWAFPLLTKPTYGIGLLWHLARREWRALALAAATTAVVVGVSMALDPASWAAWWRFLTTHAGADRWLPVRVALGAVVVLVAARTDRRALVPVGLLLATPFLGGTPVLALLAAVPRLLTPRRAARASGAARSVEQPVGHVERELE